MHGLGILSFRWCSSEMLSLSSSVGQVLSCFQRDPKPRVLPP